MTTDNKKGFGALATVKNIGIAVLTTVLGSTAVYFLGFQRSGNKEEFEGKKIATEEAWNSVVDYMRYADDKNKTIACFSCDLQQMKKEIIRGLNQNVTSLKNLQKNDKVDEKMQTVIDRAMDQFLAQEPLFTMYYDSSSAILNYPDEEKLGLSTRLQRYFFETKLHIITRDTLEIKALLDDLNRKYKLNMQLPKATEAVFDYPSLIARWNVGCVIELDFKNNHTLTWMQNQETTTGTWERTGKILNIYLNNNTRYVFEIMEVSQKILTFYEEASNVIMSACPKG